MVRARRRRLARERDEVIKRALAIITDNIARSEMPQIRKEHWDEFLEYVKGRTTLTREDSVDPYTLQMIQTQWSQERVDSIPMEKLQYPILASQDGFVLDGNHRWIKAKQAHVNIPVLRVGLNREEALDLLRDFPKAEFVANVFCPTGPGGGVNPTCSPGGAAPPPAAVTGGGGLPVGQVYTKTYKGAKYTLTVQGKGFSVESNGVTTEYSSLHAAAIGIRGLKSDINGWGFFGIDRPGKSAPATPATPSTSTPAATPTQTHTDIPYSKETDFTTGVPQPGTGVNGIAFTSAPPKFWEKTKDADIKESKAVHTISRASVMIREPDGRVWIVQPTNQFGDRKYTMPGGTIEPGLTTQQNALKEVWEETGLQVEITGHLGDFEDSNNGRHGRLYEGRRIGGAPWDAKIEQSITNHATGKPAAESDKVTLVTPERAASLLHRTDDLAQLATVNPIPVKTSTSGNMMKKLVDGIQPQAKEYRATHNKGDGELHAVQELRGFNEKPTLVDKSGMDKLVKSGSHIEMLRAVNDVYAGPSSGGKIPASKLADQFKDGEHFPGFGCFGDGTYADSSKGSGNVVVAGKYGDEVIRIAMPKSAKIIKQSELERDVTGAPNLFKTNYSGSHSSSMGWQGVHAALAGYDAIHVDGASSKHGSYGKGFYVILNRSILTVQKENAKGHVIK